MSRILQSATRTPLVSHLAWVDVVRLGINTKFLSHVSDRLRLPPAVFVQRINASRSTRPFTVVGRIDHHLLLHGVRSARPRVRAASLPDPFMTPWRPLLFLQGVSTTIPPRMDARRPGPPTDA